MNKIGKPSQRYINIQRRMMPATEPFRPGYVPGETIEPGKKLSIPSNITRYQQSAPQKINKNKR
jgi:hypothetical protein